MHGTFGDPWWWCHQMETFSMLLALCVGNSPVTGEFPHKGQWREVLMSPLTCACINIWTNKREAGDLRHHHAHYDVTIMIIATCSMRASIYQSNITVTHFYATRAERIWVDNVYYDKQFRQISYNLYKCEVHHAMQATRIMIMIGP